MTLSPCNNKESENYRKIKDIVSVMILEELSSNYKDIHNNIARQKTFVHLEYDDKHHWLEPLAKEWTGSQ